MANRQQTETTYANPAEVKLMSQQKQSGRSAAVGPPAQRQTR